MRERLEAELSDRYAIERELGRGGMATVWLARDRRQDRPVALKVLHPELAGAIGVDRFAREVRLTTRLQHPAIVPVLDSGVLPANGDVPLPWYAMAYIHGESLRARLVRDVQLPIDDALHITRDVAAALSVAHGQGIIHRDIKPENIILAGGRVYVVDFGIAKALRDTGDDRLTSTGLALGTPAYMSPEQATGSVVDARTDQYSLAAVLYEMLAGEPPVTGPTVQAVIARRLAEPVHSIRPVRSAVPEHVERAVLRALERIPADRFPDIASFASALENDAAASAPSRSPRRRRLGRTLSGVAALLILGTTAWMTLGGGRAASPARESELITLYRRGVRSYEQRTTAGSIDAIESLKAAIKRDSTFAPAWAALAKTYVRVVERQYQIPGLNPDSLLRLAVHALERAIALDTTDAEVWVGRAVVSRKIDPTRVTVAINAARKAIALDSLNGQAWHLLAASVAEQGKLDAALDVWREGARRNPSYTLVLMFMAQGHYWHHQYDSAAVWADSALAVDPNFLAAWMILGQVEVERGNFSRAIAAFDAAARLGTDVDNVNALAGRSLAQARMGRRRDARATLRGIDPMARAYVPTPLHTAVWIAHAYAASGDIAGAVSWLERYVVQEDLHYQLHVRCDPPLTAIANDPRVRRLLRAGPRDASC